MDQKERDAFVNRVRLFADRVLVEVDSEQETQTASGIFIPKTGNEEKSKTGTLLRMSKRVISEMKDQDQMDVGDTLMFSAYAGSPLEWKGKEFKVLRITDIYGALDPETKNE